jgi:predicted AAA+ superfamily ATPase
MFATMIQRNLTPALLAALSDNPVVLINGARQVGKSTLVQQLIESSHPARYLTFDNAAVLAAARLDPTGFLAGIDGPVVLDEIQRAPDLFPALKAEVDRKRQPGRYLLTGSADVLLLPQVSESLAGRMEILTLWPLSQGEIDGVSEGFIDALFGEEIPAARRGSRSRSDLIARILRGGYPEMLTRESPERRRAWYGSYITTILQRDVRDFSNIDGLTAFPRLLALLAARTTSMLNFAELSRSIAIPQTTLKRYMTLLEMTFLMQLLPAWSSNLSKRLVKTPEIILSDTGLLSHLIGLDEERLNDEPRLIGPLLENFVAMELYKQRGWSKRQPKLFHFRTQTGQEVDIVLEDAAGRVVGIEVKAADTIDAGSFKGLRVLADELGRKFRRGVVLYTGTEPLPFGKNMWALPVEMLWRT